VKRWGFAAMIGAGVAVVLVAAVGFGFIDSAGRSPEAPPPITTTRLRTLWIGAAPVKAAAAPSANGASDEELPADDPLAVVETDGLPEEPSRHDFELAMAKVQAAVDACQALEQFVGTVQVHAVINKNGLLQSAQALPPLDTTETGKCVAKAVRAAQLPKFRGTLTPTIELTYPFYFRPSDN
jgi:hypothetical protein